MAQKNDLRVPLCAVMEMYVDESVLKSWEKLGVRRSEDGEEEGTYLIQYELRSNCMLRESLLPVLGP